MSFFPNPGLQEELTAQETANKVQVEKVEQNGVQKENVVEEPNETPNTESPQIGWIMSPTGRIMIDGSNLIKPVEDNPDITIGKTDHGLEQAELWVPVNYNPNTGEMINS